MKRANYDFPKKRNGRFFGKKVNDLKPLKRKKRPGAFFGKTRYVFLPIGQSATGGGDFWLL